MIYCMGDQVDDIVKGFICNDFGRQEEIYRVKREIRGNKQRSELVNVYIRDLYIVCLSIVNLEFIEN